MTDLFEAIDSYMMEVDRLFSVQRKLHGGKVVTGPSSDELLLIHEFIGDSVKQRALPGVFGCYELTDDGNPYVTYLLCLLPYINAIASAVAGPRENALVTPSGKMIVFATTTGAMQAKAELNYNSLFPGVPVQFVTWGDLVRIDRLPISSDLSRPSLDRMFIIGDMDFEPGNDVCQMLSGDGVIRHQEIVQKIKEWAGNASIDMITFHRQSWRGAIDLTSLRTIPRKVIERKPVIPPSSCFIATACCGSPDHPAVEILRCFRDKRLRHHLIGPGLIALYERCSPPIARAIRSRYWARQVTRRLLVIPLSRWASRKLSRHPGK